MCDSSRQTSIDTDLNYWQSRWQENKIGFHRTGVHRLFEKHLLPKLSSAEQQQCVLFTLCGKTVDMAAVLAAGHRVIGIEGAQMAVEAFFTENQISYEIEKDENNQYLIYKGTDRPVTIYCGDFFNFNQSLPPIDYIWDRGGLVAIDSSTVEQYRDVLLRLMTPDRTRLFVVAINYNDPKFTGPPHKITDDHIQSVFGSKCSIEFVDVNDETEDFRKRLGVHIDFIEERLHSIVRKTN